MSSPFRAQNGSYKIMRYGKYSINKIARQSFVIAQPYTLTSNIEMLDKQELTCNDVMQIAYIIQDKLIILGAFWIYEQTHTESQIKP